MPDALPELRGFLLDLDGVLFRGDREIAGAGDLLRHLFEQRLPFCILTNNSTRTPEEYAAKLAGIGVALTPQHVLTSSSVAAAQLSRNASAQQRVLVVGSDSLRQVLRAHDIALTADWRQATDVLVGLDRDLSYEKMAAASLAIGRGARFLGTNADASFPSERGFEPGAGALLALLQATTGTAPTVFGKPQPAMFEEALRVLETDASTTAMVGDRHETDIAGAARLGLVTIGVCSGATPREAWAQLQPSPHLVFDSVRELLQALRDRGR